MHLVSDKERIKRTLTECESGDNREQQEMNQNQREIEENGQGVWWWLEVNLRPVVCGNANGEGSPL